MSWTDRNSKSSINVSGTQWDARILIISLFLIPNIFFLSCAKGTTVRLSSDRVSDVCDGDELQLTCNVTGTFLVWSTLPTDLLTNGYSVHSGGGGRNVTRQINSVTFVTIKRISDTNVLPLSSVLSLSPVTSDLNGTEIICTDLESTNSTSTIINVISSDSVQDSQEVNISVQRVQDNGDTKSNDVVIILEWSVEDNDLYTFNITVEPREQEVYYIESTQSQVQLMLSYNTVYNVTIFGSQCGSGRVLTTVELNYTKDYMNCSSPSNDTNATVTLRDLVSLRYGDSVDLSCPHGLVLTGPNTTTCMENGKWEPDPSKSTCEEPTTVTVISDSMPDNNVNLPIIVGSLLAVIVTFIILLMFCLVAFFRVKNRKKGFLRQESYEPEAEVAHYQEAYPQNRDQELEDEQEHVDHESTTGGVVYAEVGHCFNRKEHQRMCTLPFDDTPIEYAQINYNVSVSSPANEVDNKTEPDNQLIVTAVNLDNLLVQLRPQVTAKWYQFGEAVGIEKNVLDNCTKQCTPTDCIVEMLDYWLRNSVPAPTWKDVANALTKIGLKQLATDIEKVYITGKLPVEVDMQWVPHDTMSDSVVEIPPPIPPKVEGNAVKNRVQESFVPELPPKPKTKAETQEAPVRPPKQ